MTSTRASVLLMEYVIRQPLTTDPICHSACASASLRQYCYRGITLMVITHPCNLVSFYWRERASERARERDRLTLFSVSQGPNLRSRSTEKSEEAGSSTAALLSSAFLRGRRPKRSVLYSCSRRQVRVGVHGFCGICCGGCRCKS